MQIAKILKIVCIALLVGACTEKNFTDVSPSATSATNARTDADPAGIDAGGRNKTDKGANKQNLGNFVSNITQNGFSSFMCYRERLGPSILVPPSYFRGFKNIYTVRYVRENPNDILRNIYQNLYFPEQIQYIDVLPSSTSRAPGSEDGICKVSYSDLAGTFAEFNTSPCCTYEIYYDVLFYLRGPVKIKWFETYRKNVRLMGEFIDGVFYFYQYKGPTDDTRFVHKIVTCDNSDFYKITNVLKIQTFDNGFDGYEETATYEYYDDYQNPIAHPIAISLGAKQGGEFGGQFAQYAAEHWSKKLIKKKTYSRTKDTFNASYTRDYTYNFTKTGNLDEAITNTKYATYSQNGIVHKYVYPSPYY